MLDDGGSARRFLTLVETFGTMTRNTSRVRPPEDGTPAVEFEITAPADEKQQQVLDLLKRIRELSMPAPRL